MERSDIREVADKSTEGKEADERAEALRAIVEPLNGESTRAIAAVLNERGIPTVRGRKWASPQVMHLLRRLGCETLTDIARSYNVRYSTINREARVRSEDCSDSGREVR